MDLSSSGECPDAIWWISAAKMKQELSLRQDDAFAHPVPLVSEAVAVLRACHAVSSGGVFVFPGARSMKKPMSENALNYLYLREGLRGRHVPHGWRSTFSTIMNEWAAERAQAGSDDHRPDAGSPAHWHLRDRAEVQSSCLHRQRELSALWVSMLFSDAPVASALLEGRMRRRL